MQARAPSTLIYFISVYYAIDFNPHIWSLPFLSIRVNPQYNKPLLQSPATIGTMATNAAMAMVSLTIVEVLEETSYQ